MTASWDEVVDQRGLTIPDVLRGRERIYRFWGDDSITAEMAPGAAASDRVALAATLRHETYVSPLWWVSPEMCQLLDHASRTIPDHALGESDMPGGRGLVFFGQPQRVVENEPFHGIHWLRDLHSTNRGVAIISYCRSTQGWYGASRPDWWGIDEPIDSSHQYVLRMRQIVAAFWILIQQEGLASVSREKPAPRQIAAARRSGKSAPQPITVVRLRRITHQHEYTGNNTIEWTHRWIVSGHWRNQWMRSTQSHRLQWIDPHVKGPSDKPLVVKETIRALVR